MAIIAEHGSWNRSTRSGYKVSIVKMTSDVSSIQACNNLNTEYVDFIVGWLNNTEEYLGRPTDIEILDSGSIIVSDDSANKIYIIK